MPKFRKKPVVVEAFQLGGFGEPTPAPDWFNPQPDDHTASGILIPTREGSMLASWGDWIIRGVAGEIYPCKPDIFEQTYENADEPTLSEQRVSARKRSART